MTSIQVADEAFVAAAPSLAGAVVGDRARWRRWWPDLTLEVAEDRGDEGVRWRVSGPLTGTMEIWNEKCMDGFVLHYYLHAEPVAPLPTEPDAWLAEVAELNRLRRVAGKVMAFEVKQLLEAGREIGGPATAGSVA
ncbi:MULTISPECIES: hypothetical protein [Gordonia]|uniref:Polyketide cyclase / dehydrase and lipid transport n=1 Tax=Gordonia malaquae NBRC 108250 TaxID=1223542 RepID=M3VAA3_GORML|nr:hypothetical protein [Gordonia malaquae]GAC78658.1 hypothetical protein GM1_004_01030 [Gordonia malaquae NBRC 108250]